MRRQVALDDAIAAFDERHAVIASTFSIAALLSWSARSILYLRMRSVVGTPNANLEFERNLILHQIDRLYPIGAFLTAL